MGFLTGLCAPWKTQLGIQLVDNPRFYLDWSQSGNKIFDPSHCLADFPQAVFQSVYTLWEEWIAPPPYPSLSPSARPSGLLGKGKEYAKETMHCMKRNINLPVLNADKALEKVCVCNGYWVLSQLRNFPPCAQPSREKVTQGLWIDYRHQYTPLTHTYTHTHKRANILWRTKPLQKACNINRFIFIYKTCFTQNISVKIEYLHFRLRETENKCIH